MCKMGKERKKHTKYVLVDRVIVWERMHATVTAAVVAFNSSFISISLRNFIRLWLYTYKLAQSYFGQLWLFGNITCMHAIMIPS